MSFASFNAFVPGSEPCWTRVQASASGLARSVSAPAEAKPLYSSDVLGSRAADIGADLHTRHDELTSRFQPGLGTGTVVDTTSRATMACLPRSVLVQS